MRSKGIWGGGHVHMHVHGGAEPFLPALGTVHLSPSATKTLHVVETSLVKAAVSSPPTWTHPQGDTGGGGVSGPAPNRVHLGPLVLVLTSPP